MDPQRQRLLLFLGGCLFVLVGTSMIVNGDTRLANTIGGMFAGIGMIFNLLQLFFQLPFERSRQKKTQDSELLLPSSYPRKKKRQPVELLLPASYYRVLSKRQQARRDQIFKRVLPTISIVMLFPPLIGLGYLFMQFPNFTATSCTIITKQIGQGTYLDGNYAIDLTVRVREPNSSLEEAANYPVTYDTPQAAQKELNHLLIGHTYACHIIPAMTGSTGVASPAYLLLDSDVPLSFSPNRGLPIFLVKHEKVERPNYSLSLTAC